MTDALPKDRSGDRGSVWQKISQHVADKTALREGEDNPPEGGLRPDDVRALRLEGVTFRYPGSKEQIIWDMFGHSAARHFQRVNSLIDNPEAYLHNDGEFAPLLNRLSRIRDSKAAKGSARARGVPLD